MESTPEQAVEGLAIVKVLSAVLDRLVAANAPIARSGDPGQVTKFHAMKAPGIGIEQYLERIHKYASCSNECFILALIYIDRLIQRSNFLLTELNVHRVVITAVLLAAKFFDDAYYNNAYYAKVGGVLVAEMNGLEVDFLFRINFSLHVTPDLFDKYRAELLSHSTTNTTTTTTVVSPEIASQQQLQSSRCVSAPVSLGQQQQQQQLIVAAAAATTTESHLNYPQQTDTVPPCSSRITPTSSVEGGGSMDAEVGTFNNSHDVIMSSSSAGVGGGAVAANHQQQQQGMCGVTFNTDNNFIPLQRTSSLPFAPATTTIQQQYNYVPPPASTVPSLHQHNPMAAPFVTAADCNDPFLIAAALDNQIYAAQAAALVQQHQQHQHQNIQRNHGVGADCNNQYHQQNNAAYHHNNVVGRMLTGVSSAGL